MTGAAVVLAGGAARRFQAGDKTRVQLGGRTLLERVLTVLPAGTDLVVVGPRRHTVRPARFVQEEPPGGGPVAALAAGLSAVQAEESFLLAADLPFLTPRCLSSLRSAATGHDGAVAADDDGRPQWLLSYWRTEALRNALPPQPAGARLGLVLSEMDVASTALTGSPPPWWDCDTPQAWQQAKEWA